MVLSGVAGIASEIASEIGVHWGDHSGVYPRELLEIPPGVAFGMFPLKFFRKLLLGFLQDFLQKSFHDCCSKSPLKLQSILLQEFFQGLNQK